MNSKFIHTESLYISSDAWNRMSKEAIPGFNIEQLSAIEYQISKSCKFRLCQLWRIQLRITQIQDHGEKHLIKIETCSPKISPLLFWFSGLMAVIVYFFISTVNNKLGIAAIATFFLVAVITHSQRKVISTKSLISKFKATFT